MLVEYQPRRPSMRALKPGASSVFIRVWPVLKSLPAIGTPRVFDEFLHARKVGGEVRGAVGERHLDWSAA